MSSISRRLLRLSPLGEEVAVREDGSLARPGEPAPPSAEELRTAEVIIEEAQERANALVRESAEQAAAVERDAYDGGSERGYRDGVALARAELVDALGLVQQVALDAKAIRDQLLADVERQAIELVLGSLQAILGERAEDGDLTAAMVRRAIERAGAQNVIRVRVNPQQRAVVAARLADDGGEANASWEVSADGAITVGGCIVDTARGEVDARLDVQFAQIAGVFRSLAGPAPEESGPLESGPAETEPAETLPAEPVGHGPAETELPEIGAVADGA